VLFGDLVVLVAKYTENGILKSFFDELVAAICFFNPIFSVEGVVSLKFAQVAFILIEQLLNLSLGLIFCFSFSFIYFLFAFLRLDSVFWQ
jgi:hypothetical protein